MIEQPPEALARRLGLGLLTLYGLGTIIGAGIYVLIGEVVRAAGPAAPVAFALAGLLAALTAFSYAELVARHPVAAGEAAYVQAAFHSAKLTQLTGFGVALVGILSAASIARGSAHYITRFLEAPDAAVAGAVVITFTVLACRGVLHSVGIAALLTLLEIGGLIYVILGGGLTPFAGSGAVEMLPTDADMLSGVLAGAFIAFFAFLGFEALANMAEEAREVGRTLPRAILLSVAVSTALYVAVAVIAVMVVPEGELTSSRTPLIDVIARSPIGNVEVLTGIALIATMNGVLIDTLMVARVTYGMANRGWLPAALAVVHPRHRVPQRATILVGAVIFVFATSLPLGTLARLTSTVTLLVFALVNLSLWRLKTTEPARDLWFVAPGWLPPVGVAASLALILSQMIF